MALKSPNNEPPFLLDAERFYQIEQMSFVQTEDSGGRRAIAIRVRQRLNDNFAFGGFEGMTIG